MNKNLNILYVEDGQKVRSSLSRSLTLAYSNKAVTVAKDGLEGYNLFKNNPAKFDLIITDINMPKLDGIEMIEKIRILNSNIPIFITSAFEVCMNRIKNLNVTHIMDKPLNVFSLLEKINYKFELESSYKK